jgi:hypothetical protein
MGDSVLRVKRSKFKHRDSLSFEAFAPDRRIIAKTILCGAGQENQDLSTSSGGSG